MNLKMHVELYEATLEKEKDVEEEEEGKIVPGSQGKSKTDYFRDKFIISLKIQYGCWLENVNDCGREGVNTKCKIFATRKKSILDLTFGLVCKLT